MKKITFIVLFGLLNNFGILFAEEEVEEAATVPLPRAAVLKALPAMPAGAAAQTAEGKDGDESALSDLDVSDELNEE